MSKHAGTTTGQHTTNKTKTKTKTNRNLIQTTCAPAAAAAAAPWVGVVPVGAAVAGSVAETNPSDASPDTAADPLSSSTSVLKVNTINLRQRPPSIECTVYVCERVSE